jgi:hypothetical protein
LVYTYTGLHRDSSCRLGRVIASGHASEPRPLQRGSTGGGDRSRLMICKGETRSHSRSPHTKIAAADDSALPDSRKSAYMLARSLRIASLRSAYCPSSVPITRLRTLVHTHVPTVKAARGNHHISLIAKINCRNQGTMASATTFYDFKPLDSTSSCLSPLVSLLTIPLRARPGSASI